MYGNFWYTYGKNRVTSAPLSRIPPMLGILGLRWRDPQLHSYFDVYTRMSHRQDRLDTVRDVTDERIPIGGTPGLATLNARNRHIEACNRCLAVRNRLVVRQCRVYELASYQIQARRASECMQLSLTRSRVVLV